LDGRLRTRFQRPPLYADLIIAAVEIGVEIVVSSQKHLQGAAVSQVHLGQ
jgi:hypothetical protein